MSPERGPSVLQRPPRHEFSAQRWC
jgi:hypothetical protein